jgi:UDP-N-acetylglucosamine--N-acetylmuramyl-(pentapeptide) pyrophosphoryl-undecaprenol N-acetylglucosamine transferase
MELAYNAADIVVSRAGAASLTEIAHYRLPSILVPYPHAAENHQERNAEIFEQAGAAQILAQGKLDGEHLAHAIRTLLANEHRRKRMSDELATLDKPNATGEVISLLKQAAKREPAAQPTEATA